MTGEELGRVLGDAISDLENATVDIEGAVSQLLDIDGKVILLGDNDVVAANQPSMTIEELGEIIGNALSELECVVSEIEGARDLLQAIDGATITTSESDDSSEIDD